MKEFKPTQEMIDSALRVFEAMAWVQVVEPIVTAYQKEILAKHQFKTEDGEVITTARDMYMASDADFALYHAESKEARKLTNLHVEHEDFCPLLVAENNVLKVEWRLIDSVEPLTGVSKQELYGKERDRYIDLILRLLAPSVRR